MTLKDWLPVILGGIAIAGFIFQSWNFRYASRDRDKAEGRKEKEMEQLKIQVDAAHSKLRLLEEFKHNSERTQEMHLLEISQQIKTIADSLHRFEDEFTKTTGEIEAKLTSLEQDLRAHCVADVRPKSRKRTEPV